MTRLPLAESRRLLVMESRSTGVEVGVHGEEGRENDGEVQEEVSKTRSRATQRQPHMCMA